MKKILKIFLIILIFLVLFLAIQILFFNKFFNKTFFSIVKPPTNFQECLAGNNIIRETYPRQCVAKDGRVFTEDIGNELQKIDLIRVASPRPNTEIKSPLKISGQARGFWFFEASFPVFLFDNQDNLLASGIATANPPAGGDWMTEDFVPFETELNFSLSITSTAGYLLLKKDNPSGLKQNDDFLKMPIILIK